MRHLALLAALVAGPALASERPADLTRLTDTHTPVHVRECAPLSDTDCRELRIGFDARGRLVTIGDLSRAEAERILRAWFCPAAGPRPFLDEIVRWSARRTQAALLEERWSIPADYSSTVNVLVSPPDDGQPRTALECTSSEGPQTGAGA